MTLFKNQNGIEKNTLALLNVFYIYNQAKQVNYYSLSPYHIIYIYRDQGSLGILAQKFYLQTSQTFVL